MDGTGRNPLALAGLIAQLLTPTFVEPLYVLLSHGYLLVVLPPFVVIPRSRGRSAEPARRYRTRRRWLIDARKFRVIVRGEVRVQTSIKGSEMTQRYGATDRGDALSVLTLMAQSELPTKEGL